jgi:hypothetical protein
MIINDNCTYPSEFFQETGGFQTSIPTNKTVMFIDDNIAVGSRNVIILYPTQIQVLGKHPLEKKTDDFIRTIQIDRLKHEFDIKDETILDGNKILQKIPRIMTVAEAFCEQDDFVKKQRERERKYRLSTENDLIEEI